MSFLGEIKRRKVFHVAAVYMVVSWLIIQIVATVESPLNLPSWVDTLVIVLLAVGFPLAIIFTWAFQLTPDGITRDRAVEGPGSDDNLAGRRFGIVVIALLTVVLAYFALDKFATDPPQPIDNSVATSAGPSVAVLPFVNMSSDSEQEYFSDGLSEELLNLLAKVPELRVSARTSSFSFKNKNLPIPVIAEQLNVAHVLEGSVRKSGNTVRITAQLIDGSSDQHLWSKTYDRTLDDIFAVQDEIAADVVRQLEITLLGVVPKSRTTDPEAYSLYLQAAYITAQLDNSRNAEAESLFRRALALDQDYAPAWRELSRVLGRQLGTGPSIEEDVNLTREALDRALQIDPLDAAAMAYRAWGLANYDADFVAAARLFEESIAVDPRNEHVLRSASIFARAFAQEDEALAISAYAVKQNPVCFGCNIQLVQTLMMAGHLDEAEEIARSMQSLFNTGPRWLGMTQLLNNQAHSALESFNQVEDQSARLFGTALASYDLNRIEDFAAAFEELHLVSSGSGSNNIARIYAYTNQPEAAMDIIESRFEQAQVESGDMSLRSKYIEFALIFKDPFLQKLNGNKRWQALFEAHGISEELPAMVKFEPVLVRAN